MSAGGTISLKSFFSFAEFEADLKDWLKLHEKVFARLLIALKYLFKEFRSSSDNSELSNDDLEKLQRLALLVTT